MLIDLYKSIQKYAEESARAKQALTAKEKYEAKKQATVDFIQRHTVSAIVRLQDNTERLTRADISQQQSQAEKSVSTGESESSTNVSRVL